jgi:hypothetical protein
MQGVKRSDNMNPRLMKTRCCPLVRWSNPSIKDILEALSRGKGATWEIPRDTPDFWHEHMRSEVKRVRPNATTGRPEVQYILVGKRQTHTRDCECMQVVMAIIGKVLGDEASYDQPEEKEAVAG